MNTRVARIIFAAAAATLLITSMAQAQNTLTAWCTVLQQLPTGHRLPFGTPQDLRITLETTTSNAYQQTIDSNSRQDQRANWFSSGEYHFFHVPTDVPLALTVEYRFTNRTDTYRITYRFSYPSALERTRFGTRRAVRVAGYMGDFILNVAAEQITREDRPVSRIR